VPNDGFVVKFTGRVELATMVRLEVSGGTITSDRPELVAVGVLGRVPFGELYQPSA
jgi:hypothetical protein